jgi:transposase-like protein
VPDGAKALSRAVQDVFDQSLIQRCQQHKIKNVRYKLPERLRAVAERRMRQACHAESALKVESLLTDLARELDKTHLGAAASLREGMAETLTILRLGVPPTLARTLRSTNPVESMIEICREHSQNVKRWRDGTMALRWCGVRMLEADLSGGWELASTGDWASGNPAFVISRGSPQRAVPDHWTRPPGFLACCCPLNLSDPGKPFDPGISLRIPPG